MANRAPEAHYCDVMTEIRERMLLVRVPGPRAPLSEKVAGLEMACLQIRKVLELIAFGSLIANKTAYAAKYEDFASHWNAERLLRDLERVHPKFYPTALEERASATPGVKMHHTLLKSALTREEFVDVYKKCGRMLHVGNPFGGKQISLAFYAKSIPLWLEKIGDLLRCHTIQLFGVPTLWLVHFAEPDGHPRVYTSEPV